MSALALATVLPVAGITGNQKCVLLAIAALADDNGQAQLSAKQLAQCTCLSESTVWRAVGALAAAGHVMAEAVRGVGYRVSVTGCVQGATSTRTVATVSQLVATVTQPVSPPEATVTQPVATSSLTVGPTADAQPSPYMGFKNTLSGSEVTVRPTRIPDDFAATAEMVAWAARECPRIVKAGAGSRITAEFADYYRGLGGERSRNCDWVATWRNWMRRKEKEMPEDITYGAPAWGSPEHLRDLALEAKIRDSELETHMHQSLNGVKQ